MKKLCLLFCILLSVAFSSGCTPHTDYLAPLRGDFEAEVSGEVNGVAFSALCLRETASEGVTVTVTFYAPATLADTVAKKAPDGAISLSVGELTISSPSEGLSPLFDLFLPTGEVTDAVIDENGHTQVQCNGFTLTLLPDGTPYLLQTPAATATVIRFTPK